MKPLTRLFVLFCACNALVSTVLAGPERLPSGKEMKEIAPAPAPECNWTGFYVGINGGYTWSDNDNVSTDSRDQFGNPLLGGGPEYGVASAELATFDLHNSNDGFIGGGQLGANLEVHRFVIGIEADLQAVLGGDENDATRQDSSIAPVGFAGFPIVQSARVERDISNLGTVRGRLGFIVTPCLLVYATGGLAYGEVFSRTDIQQLVLNAPLIPNSYSAHGHYDNLKAGWTAGGGLEWMFMRHLSLKAEYLYYDLGTVTYGLSNLNNFNTTPTLFTTALPTSSTDFNGHIVRGGLNFHF
jgi:outer membrane immunogenic protein